MRLCVIGNSHIIALALGCNRDDVVFFGSNSRTLKTLQGAGGEITSTDPAVRRRLGKTSGGRESICVPEYDAFLVVGCGLGFATTTSIYREHRLPQHVINGEQLISNAVFARSAYGLIARSLARRIADLLHKNGAAQVAILPEPLPAASITDKYTWLAKEEIRSALMKMYRETLDKIPYPVLEQPRHTVAADFTKSEFLEKPVRQIKKQGEEPYDDPFHMDAAYGACAMEAAYSYFESLRSGSPASAQAGD